MSHPSAYRQKDFQPAHRRNVLWAIPFNPPAAKCPLPAPSGEAVIAGGFSEMHSGSGLAENDREVFRMSVWRARCPTKTEALLAIRQVVKLTRSGHKSTFPVPLTGERVRRWRFG